MKELFVISAGVNTYGVWKDDFLHLREIGHVHGLPLIPDGVSGVCVMDNRTSLLFDLGVCLGHRAFDRRGPGKALMMSEAERSEGFIFEGEATRLQIPPEEMFAMPDYLKAPECDQCVLHSGQLLPVINIAVLYKRFREKQWERPVVDFQNSGPPPNVSSARAFRVFELCGMAFAVPDDFLEAEATRPGPIRRIPLAPSYVEGIVFKNERVSMVLNPARYMGLNQERERDLLIMTKSGGLGFLVDADRGVLRDKVTPQPMPLTTSSDFMAYGLVRDREVIPLLNIHALVSRTPDRPSSNHYTPESRFASVFGKENVEILKFSLAGMRHSLPASEVEDVVDFKPPHKIGGGPSIMIGVAEHGGEILPVLDLAACFGRRTEATADSKMILLKNGNFRALVVTQATSNKQLLAVEEQKHVPIAQPWPYVYGCHLDGETVGLILNVEALTTHFEETQMQAFFAMLDQEVEKEPVAPSRPQWLSRESSATPKERQLKKTREATEPAETGETSPEGAGTGEQEPDTLPYDASWTGTLSESGEVEADVADVVSDSDGAEAAAAESRRAEPQTVTALPGPPPWDEAATSPVVPEPAVSWAETGTGAESDKDEAPLGAVLSDTEGAQGDEAPTPPWDATAPGPTGAEPAARVPPQSAAVDAVEWWEDEQAEVPTVLSGAADQAPLNITVPVRLYADAVSERKGQRWGIYAAITLLLAAVLFWALEIRKPDQEKLFEEVTAFTEERKNGEQEAVPAVEEPNSLERQRSLLDREATPAAGKTASLDQTELREAARIAAPPVAQTPSVIQDELREARIVAPPVAQTPSVVEDELRAARVTAPPAEQLPSVVQEELREARIAAPPVAQLPSVVQEQLREARGTAPVQKEEAIVLMEVEPTKEVVSLRIVTTLPAGAQLYVVKKGDTLWDIAERFTGNPFNYPGIAADSHIHNPDLIFPEQKIFITIKGE